MRNLSQRLLLIFVASLLAATAGAAPRKVRVNDPAEADALIARGGKLIADYGAFRLIEVEEAQPANLRAGTQPSVDESDIIQLNAKPLNTRATEVKSLRRAVGSFVGRKLHLVHFAGPVKPEWRAVLEQAGARVVAYVPQNAYLIYGDASALTQMQTWAGATNVVQWEGEYADDYKIHPRAKLTDAKGLPQNPVTDTFAVQLVDDDAMNADTLVLIDQMKLEPIKRQFRSLDYVNVIVRLPPARLAEIAAHPEVISIQPYLEPQKRDERQDQILAGNITGVGPSGPGYLAWLTGKRFSQSQFTTSGFAVDVTDSGIDNGTTSPGHFGLYVLGNPGLASRVIYNRLQGTPNSGSTKSGCDGHGNLNTHIIAGYNDFAPGFPHTDAAGFHYGLGVCPFVKVGSSVIFDPDNYTFPNYANLQSQAYQDGARISANSWGAPVGGAYNVDSQSYDALVRDAQPSGSTFATTGNQQMVIVFAAGNNGSSAQTVGSPGTGKNVITVGASENVHSHSTANGGNDPSGNDRCAIADSGADNLNDIIYFSSRGPCSDGRMKPDLVAPGTHVTGGVGQSVLTTNGTGSALSCFVASGVCALPGGGTAGNPDNFFPLGQQFYTTSSGTSHSTPAVAGACALLRQYFINQTLPPPSPAMTKAYLMNSTRYLTGVDANDTLWSPNQGMGEMNLGAAFDGLPRILSDQTPTNKFTATGQTRVFTGRVADPTKPFRVTLAWTDAPGSTTGNAWNNDLDLTVTIGGNTYKGNVFSGAFSVTGGTADSMNNVESVYLPAGSSNTFTVTVTAANINSDGVPNEAPSLDQDFAMVVYNAIGLPGVTPNGYSVSGEGCLPANGGVDAGETVTVNFALSNVGLGNATNLMVTLLATNGVQFPSSAQNYGTVMAGGGAISRPFTFTANGSCGGSINPTFLIQDGVLSLGALTQTVALGALTLASTGFTNATSLTIPTSGNASVYPSTITVSNVVGTVTNVTVTLRSLSHNNPDDIDVLLVGPGGQTVLLMSDCGGSPNISGVTLTFDDNAVNSLPDSTTISSGTYKPTNFDTSTDGFSSPAPSGSYGSTLSVFNGVNPNGTWSLYVRDDTSPTSGSLAQGWTLRLGTSNLVCCSSAANLADVAIGSSITPAPVNVGSNVTLTLSVTNFGPNASSQVIVTDALPAGLTFISTISSQGTCTNNGGVVVGVLGPMVNGATATVTVNAVAALAGNITNIATVNTAITDPMPLNNTNAISFTVNALPNISAITNQMTSEDVALGPLNFTVSDAETPAGSLTLGKFSSNPSLVPNANIVLGGSGSNRTVTVTPVADTSGTTTITLAVSDGIGTVSNAFLLTVDPVNDPPVLAAIADRMIFEGLTLVFTNVVTDVDSPANQRTFGLLGAPVGAAINTTNGIFTWTPSETQGPSTNVFAVFVNDNGTPNLSATQSVTVVVLETNSAPTLGAISNYVIWEGQLLTFTNSAVDADLPPNILTYYLDTNAAPAGASVDPATGVFAWTPSEAQGPSTNHISVIVQDNGAPSLSATQSFTVMVLESNTAPVLAAIPDVTVFEGQLVVFTNVATDVDLPANLLTFSLDTNTAPVGAAVDATSGVFAWTPSEARGPSTNHIQIVVADDGVPSLTATQSFTVIVLESNSPPVLAPVLANLLNQIIYLGQTVSFTNVVSDPDVPANNLIFSLPNAPLGAVLNTTNGVFTWTPDATQAPSTNQIAMVVTDDGVPSMSATQFLTVTVLVTNHPPVLTSIADKIVHAGTVVTFTNSATDADTNNLTFSLDVAPVGASVDTTNGIFLWPTTDADAGTTNAIQVRVTDDGAPSAFASQSFNVTVMSRPVIQSITVSNQVVQLTWSSITGQTYRLQSKLVITGTSWNDIIPDITAVDWTATNSHALGTEAQRFYRVVLVP